MRKSTDPETQIKRVPLRKKKQKKKQQEMAWMTKQTLKNTKQEIKTTNYFITLSKALGQKGSFTNHWLSTH